MHGFYAIMGGFQIDISNHGSEQPERKRLRPHVLLDLADEGRFHELNIAGADLTDKSKFDVLGSTVACGQALWFCAQSIARFRQGLAISLLEVSTVAHVVLSVFTLILWWAKPQSVNRGHIIMHQLRMPQIEQMIRYERILKRSDSEFRNSLARRELYLLPNILKGSKRTANLARRTFQQSARREALSDSSFLLGSRESLWMFHKGQSRKLRDRWFPHELYFWATTAFWIPVAVFGAIHMAAWNEHFPTAAEHILWLVASGLVTAISLLYGLGALLVLWFGDNGWKELLPSTNGAPVRYGHGLGTLVIFAHIYLFIASWIDLRFLPASAFQTVDWTAAFPHFS